MKKSHSLSLLVLAVAHALSMTAHAAETRGERVVVTAKGLSETVDASRANVVVIDRAAIEARQTPDVLELLRLEAGVEFSRTGGRGSLTTLFLRGGNSNQALVLIDGVRVSSANTGFFDLSQLPVDLIERVEIVYGPRAAYWGSDAIGGVIQFFLRQPKSGLVGIRAGSKDQLDVFGAYTARGERGSLGFTIGQQNSGGFSASNPNGFGFDPDDDSYENNHVTFHASTGFAEQTLSFHGMSTESWVEFDQGESDFDHRNAAVTLEGAWTDRWSHRLSVGHADDDVVTPAYFSRFDSARETLDWQNRYVLSETAGQLSFGVHAKRERGGEGETFAGSSVYREDRDSHAVHLGWSGDFGAHGFELAGRLDDHDFFGSEETFQAAWTWQVADAWRVLTQFGEGYRSPTLSEQFSPGFGGLFAGNPLLEPELSRAVEVGIDWTIIDGHALKLNLYRNRVTNLIAFQGDDFQAINVARARIEGAEFGYRGAIGDWTLAGNVTIQNPENRDTNADLLRRAPRRLNFVADYRIGSDWLVGAETVLVDRRNEFGSELPGYGLLNLSTRWQIGDKLAISGRVENLLDQNYELARGFNTPGTTVTVGIVWGE